MSRGSHKTLCVRHEVMTWTCPLCDWLLCHSTSSPLTVPANRNEAVEFSSCPLRQTTEAVNTELHSLAPSQRPAGVQPDFMMGHKEGRNKGFTGKTSRCPLVADCSIDTPPPPHVIHEQNIRRLPGVLWQVEYSLVQIKDCWSLTGGPRGVV